METKQTAVDFLIEHIKIDAMYEAKTLDEWVLVFDRAKQMEKEQIIDAVEWNYKSNMGEVYYKATYEIQRD
jgi:hypothetical protein